MPVPAARYIGGVTDKLILINLLVKLGVAASVASVLARASTFRRLFFAERRRPRQTLGLLAFFLVPLTLGVWIRTTVPNFLAADISFETVILLGLLIGPGWAMLGGVVLAAPAVYHGEYLAPLFNAGVGLLAGTLGRFLDPEEIWSFTPFIDLSLYRWVRRVVRRPRVDRQFLMLFLIVAAEACRDWLAHMFPRKLFALLASEWWLQVLVWLTAPIVVGIALKVWNALRIEMKFEEQKRLVLEARLDALQRQINPHFLFNTLNSIAALVRTRPELAREMTVKLANILRALLKDHDTYVPLSDELSFTDDYLDIEVVRFGADKLRVEKEIDPRTLSVPVPSILLQPLIENSIKHGLEPRLHGGTVTLRSKLEGNRVRIEVADDGVGMGPRPQTALKREGAGIGMKNVQERLEVLYGAQAEFKVESSPGRGTLVSIEIPAVLSE
ncbi:MAG TPA: histidine kinase [Terracidiphilus sp.]|nr:histidine kinase [Terracidiphilus sp.]